MVGMPVTPFSVLEDCEFEASLNSELLYQEEYGEETSAE